jgi:hypothetical protein
MRKKARGNFELRSNLGKRDQVPSGSSIEHRVTIFNYADFDIQTGFVSRCRDDAIAYVRSGEAWEPVSARLEAREFRLRPENSFEFPEDLGASDVARTRQMSQVIIKPWRRRLAPTSIIEWPLDDGLVHNVRVV